MTRTIFLIVSITATALAVAVPSALGRPLPVGSSEQADAVKYFYANERATIPLPAAVNDHGDATQAKSLGQVDAVTYFYANERSTIPSPAVVHDHGSATQAKLLVQSPTSDIVRDNGDATQARLARLSAPVVVREDSLRVEGRSDPLLVRDHGDAEQAMLEAPSSGHSVAGVESNSGWELDWSQLAIGFGIGIVLATLFGLSLKAMRPRTLVH